MSTNSGTSAIHSALFAVGVKWGDEIIVPTLSYHSTVTPLFQIGAKPILCDSESNTGNIDPNSLIDCITRKTKAIVVTHLFGHPVNISKITKIAKEFGLNLIEDCSHAYNALYKNKKVGTFGDVACFSFQSKKAVRGGEGGILVTSDKDIYYRATLLGHARRRILSTVRKDWALKFEMGLGFNYKIHPLAAVIAIEDMKRLPKFIRNKKKNLKYFNKQLNKMNINGVKPLFIDRDCELGASHCYSIKIDQDGLKSIGKETYLRILSAENLNVDNISIQPLHKKAIFKLPMKNYFKDFIGPKFFDSKPKYKKGDFLVSEEYFNNHFLISGDVFDSKYLLDKHLEGFQKVDKQI